MVFRWAWSLYVSNIHGGRDVYYQPLRGNTAEGVPRRVTTGLRIYGIASRAETVAYSVWNTSVGIWSFPFPRSGAVSFSRVAARQIISASERIEALRISPDGQWLAFDSDRSGNMDIYKNACRRFGPSAANAEYCPRIPSGLVARRAPGFVSVLAERQQGLLCRVGRWNFRAPHRRWAEPRLCRHVVSGRNPNSVRIRPERGRIRVGALSCVSVGRDSKTIDHPRRAVAVLVTRWKAHRLCWGGSAPNYHTPREGMRKSSCHDRCLAR